MNINSVKINSFGKLKNREINFKKGINIIYGENEAGKSTLIKFILTSLYGISKNKKGKLFSEYEKYLPWTGEDFSGNIEYEIDNGEKYRIHRNFKKRAPEVYNEKMEEISANYNIDKTKGSEVFYEQSKVDEELFISTLMINQKEVQLENKEQNILIQKIANIMGTGEDKISYKKAIEKLNKIQLDEVGSDRTKEKPINIVKNSIVQLEKEREELFKYKEEKYNIQDIKREKTENIEELEEEKKILLELKNVFENERAENEKIEIRKEINHDKEKKIEDLESEIKKIKEAEEIPIENRIEQAKRERIKIHKKEGENKKILILILIILNIIQFISIRNITINSVISLLTIALFLILRQTMGRKNLEEKQKEELLRTEKEKIIFKRSEKEKEIKELKNDKRKEDDELYSVKNKIKEIKEKEKEKIFRENNIDGYKLDYFNGIRDMKNLESEIEDLKGCLNKEILEIHKLDINNQSIDPKLEKLTDIEEDLDKRKEELKSLNLKNESITIAKQVLEESYEEMRDNVTPKFTNKLNEIIAKITKGKYTKVMLNDKMGLLVENEQGQYVQADKLSVGTIEQLYFSLRIALIEEISNEKMPIILDEAFAYYDTKRLKNVLEFLNENCNKHQVFIITCTNREIEELDKMNIAYNKIQM